jgi:hypothetical protein
MSDPAQTDKLRSDLTCKPCNWTLVRRQIKMHIRFGKPLFSITSATSDMITGEQLEACDDCNRL